MKTNMQAYVGCKVVLAEECSKECFDRHKANGFPVENTFEDGDRKADMEYTEGYHVVYSNPDGSKYHSWSPKDQFERSYRRVFTDEKILISQY
jgi:hypothetical protein